MKPLEQVLAEMATVRELDASVSVAALERWTGLIRDALKAEGDRWLSEERALRRCGKAAGWLRVRRRRWAQDGYAERRNGRWFYHEAAIPRSPSQPQASDDPREQARRDAA